MKTCAQVLAAWLPPALNVLHYPDHVLSAWTDASTLKVVVTTDLLSRGWYPSAPHQVIDTWAHFDTVEAAFAFGLEHIATHEDRQVLLILKDQDGAMAAGFLLGAQVESDDLERTKAAWARGPFLSLYGAPESAQTLPRLRNVADWLFWVSRNADPMIRTAPPAPDGLWAKNAPLSKPLPQGIEPH